MLLCLIIVHLKKLKPGLDLVPNEIKTEASGGINLTNLASYSDTGVDVISLGFLTHTVKALDISVKVQIG